MDVYLDFIQSESLAIQAEYYGKMFHFISRQELKRILIITNFR